MFSKAKVLRQVIFVFIASIVVFTRFYNLDWGNHFFFQPDENNMATAIAQFSSKNYNPHFFAYGQFPLYLGYFSLLAIHQPVTFVSAIFILRLWSAFFSVLALVCFYSIYPSIIFLLFLIFSPGLIQISHYGTTESLLVFVFGYNLYISKLILKNPLDKKNYLFAAMITGVGLASKISSLVFLTPVIFAIIFSARKFKNLLYPIFILNFIFLLTLLTSVLLSPYNLIEKKDFRSALSYETQVATGAAKVFYTNQFLHTPQYLFQLVKIFPYTSGITTFTISILAIFCLPFLYKKNYKEIFIYTVGFSVLIYFAYFGHVYVKWTRFMSPIFFIPPLLSALLIQKIQNKSLKIISIIFCVFPGILFLSLYTQPDIRIQASSWINKNIPTHTMIFSEAGNVVNLPLTDNSFNTINFDFYNLDSNSTLSAELAQNIFATDYILIPSRRIFANQYGLEFPKSTKYYRSLASGDLGFILIKDFTPQVDFLLDSEAAEETWSVFDHPTIRIYKKVRQLTKSEYETLLKP